ncbi:MAG: hypothetical protein LKE53_01915 [Oscillospiraceae bacterium]|nr:hypothetical protein [Oscillospiraceae bacterium]MDD3261799.1 hypothetical protein [Oscillospiraceae bacterium]
MRQAPQTADKTSQRPQDPAHHGVQNDTGDKRKQAAGRFINGPKAKGRAKQQKSAHFTPVNA